MTDVDRDLIPRVILVFNGPLNMSPGKMASQAFQVCERLHRCLVPDLGETFEVRQAVRRWKEHTTTIARVATTPKMFERVCEEVPGVVMIDEGYTEVDPGTPTVFASWPVIPLEEHKLLGNSKVKLLRPPTEDS